MWQVKGLIMVIKNSLDIENEKKGLGREKL